MRTENRKHGRVPSRLRAWCESDNITLYARIGNLSEGGLFLQTNTPLAEGCRTRLRLGGGGMKELMAEATVVWQRERRGEKGTPGMGLRFDGLDSGALAILRRIISEEQRMVALGN